MKVIEAKREYIVTDTAMTKCDLCKKFFAKVFELTPVTKTHAFDNIVLCAGCLNKCHLTYNIDLKELMMAGSVDEWQKNKN